jgi:hypothetical protein
MDEYLIPNSSFLRLYNEYKKYGSLVVGFDFDGTVHDYHKTGTSHEKVRQLLRDLKLIGCKLVCWTAYPDLEYVANFCKENNIPYDDINKGGIPLGWESAKPFFSVLLDDRAGLQQVYQELTLLINLINNKNA